MSAVWPPKMQASVIRLSPGHSLRQGAQKIQVRTTSRLVQGIEAIRSAHAWFDATGWVTIAGRCVTVRRPIGWTDWVYFEKGGTEKRGAS